MNIRKKWDYMDIEKRKRYIKLGKAILFLMGIIFCVWILWYVKEDKKAVVDAFGVIFALVGVVMVVSEIKQNKSINEAELVIRINTEFINNPELVKVEHMLEKYFYLYNLISDRGEMEQEYNVKTEIGIKEEMDERERKRREEINGIKDVSGIKLELDLDIDSHERQELVNYLVHLESVATLVNNNILRLEAISDLVAYRYFIAVNNLYVQKYELMPYKDYYKECYKIYGRWKALMDGKGLAIPMGKNGKIFDQQST